MDSNDFTGSCWQHVTARRSLITLRRETVQRRCGPGHQRARATYYTRRAESAHSGLRPLSHLFILAVWGFAYALFLCKFQSLSCPCSLLPLLAPRRPHVLQKAHVCHGWLDSRCSSGAQGIRARQLRSAWKFAWPVSGSGPSGHVFCACPSPPGSPYERRTRSRPCLNTEAQRVQHLF